LGRPVHNSLYAHIATRTDKTTMMMQGFTLFNYLNTMETL